MTQQQEEILFCINIFFDFLGIQKYIFWFYLDLVLLAMSLQVILENQFLDI